MRKNMQSIRNKVLFFGLLMTIIPLALISVYYIQNMAGYVGETGEEMQKMRLEHLATDIRSEIRQVMDQLDVLASLERPTEMKGPFYEVLSSQDAIDTLVVIDQDGVLLSQVARHTLNHADTGDTWPVQGASGVIPDAGEPVISDVLVNEYGQPYMQMIAETGTDGLRIGAAVQLQKLIGNVSSYQLDDEAVIYLEDPSNQVIAHQDYSKLWQPSTEETSRGIEIRTEIDEVQWELVMEQPRREALSPVFDMMRRGGFTATVMILFGSVISVFAGLYFVKPIETLQQGMRRMKTGYWPEAMPVERQDEFGELTQAFNEMNETIQEKEQRLRQEKERLDIVVNSMDAGLAVVRKDYSIAWMNPKLEGWIGEKREVPCFRLFHDQDDACYACPLRDEVTYDKMDEILTRKDRSGQERIYRHRVFPLNYTLEQDEEALIVMEDITEEKQMEEKIIQTDKLSALGLMASSFAHEVNNPLASVQIYAEDLSDRLTEDEAELLESGDMAHYLQVIRKNIDRCKTITGNLLNFSRKENWEERDIRVRKVVEESLVLMNHSLNKQGVDVTVTEEEGLPEVRGDALKLSQVFVNFIQNALDAMADRTDPELSIRLYQEGHDLLVDVADNGSGIRPEDLDKLFDPFFTSKPTGKGTGLGLSVCYGIIQQMNGVLEVESEPGQGAVFRLRLPVPQKETKPEHGEV